MKIGVNTWVWTSPFGTKDYGLIPKIKSMGFDIIEVAAEDPSIIDAALLRRTAEEHVLSIIICGAFGTSRDISSDDPAIRRNGADYIVECIRLAQAVGSTLVAGPVYSAVGKARLVSADQKARAQVAEVKIGAGVSISSTKRIGRRTFSALFFPCHRAATSR